MPEMQQSTILNNRASMPLLGLGTSRIKSEETAQVVALALAHGYRLIDTAAVYNNERQVGEGIRQSGLRRSDIFITSKLWMTDYGRENAVKGFRQSNRKLGLDYIDLYLLHWPAPTNFKATVEAYKGLESLLADGLIRAVGVSNFSAHHLDALSNETTLIPAVNQVELHPFFIQSELRGYHATRNIVTEAWSPIGGAYNRNSKAASPLRHPIIRRLAEKYKKTPAQVVLRWHIQRGIIAIPKSTKPERIAENIGVFDFTLTSDHIEAIDSLDTGKRSGGDPAVVQEDTFPIKIEDYMSNPDI